MGSIQGLKGEQTMRISVETLSEARKLAKEMDGTYRKVCGGWIVMDWVEARIWDKQK